MIRRDSLMRFARERVKERLFYRNERSLGRRYWRL